MQRRVCVLVPPSWGTSIHRPWKTTPITTRHVLEVQVVAKIQEFLLASLHLVKTIYVVPQERVFVETVF